MANYYFKNDKYIQAINLRGLTKQEREKLGLQPVLKNRWNCQYYYFLQKKEEDGSISHYHTCSKNRAKKYELGGWNITKRTHEDPLAEYLVHSISEL